MFVVLTSASDAIPIVARDKVGCVVCDPTVQLVCPATCDPGYECKFAAQTCEECPKSFCAPSPDTKAALAGSNNGPSTAAIAGGVGGVVGGVALIGFVTYLVWKFYVKNKRSNDPYDQTKASWADDEDAAGLPDGEKPLSTRYNARASTHTVHSIASTVLTRASNIIQIAYIPGVTNRAAPPASPTVLVPPVPPIPMQVGSTSGSLSGNSAANSPTAYEPPHFFVPSDLRDSTYSGYSNFSDRTSFARTSYAARSSIASTMYNGKHAVISQAGVGTTRLKPAIVSVRSTGSGANSAGANTPPMPSIDFEKYGLRTQGRPVSRAESTFSVGSTFLQNATSSVALSGKAQVVRVGSGSTAKTLASRSGRAAPGNSKLSEELEPEGAKPGVDIPLITVRDSSSATLVDISSPTPSDQSGPFSDPPERPTHRSTGSLSAVIEEATRKAAAAKGAAEAAAEGAEKATSSEAQPAAAADEHRRSRLDPGNPTAGSSEREGSPFADEHAVRE